MSVAAQKWALEQRVGSAGSKFVLFVLGNYADVTGACWPSQETLARDTDQSVATVQRCLRQLERLGKIYIGPRRVKKNGHAGARQYVILHDSWAEKYALEIGYDPEQIGQKYEKCLSDEEGEENQDDEENQTLQIDASAENGAQGNQIDGGKDHENRHIKMTCQDGAAQMLQIDVSADTSLAPYQEQPYQNNPPNLPPAPDAAALEEGSWLAVWRKLELLWPWKDSDARHRVRERVRQMEPADRDQLVHAAEAYLADCRAKGKAIASARGFFGTDLWRDWALKARGGKGRDVGASVFVRKDSDAWRAWLGHKGVRSLPTTRKLIEGRLVEGWHFPTLFPPRSGTGPPGASA